MTIPQAGTLHRFTGEQGLAAGARIADPDVSDELTSEMHDLDMHPDTEVTVTGFDEDRGLVLVEWTDLTGNPRATSIEPGTFDEQFEEV